MADDDLRSSSPPGDGPPEQSTHRRVVSRRPWAAQPARADRRHHGSESEAPDGAPGGPGDQPRAAGSPSPPPRAWQPPPPAAWQPPPPAAWQPPPPGAWQPPPPGAGQPPPPGAWQPYPPGGGQPPPPGAWPPPPPGAWPPPPPGGWQPYPGQPQAAWSAWGQPIQGGRFRPMGVGEILDGAFSLYRRNFLVMVSISAVAYVPFAALTVLLYAVLGVGDRLQATQDALSTRGAPGSSTQVGDLNAVAIYGALILVVSLFVVQPLLVAAMTRAASDRYLDRPITLATAYRTALRRWRPLLACVGLALVAVVVPAVAILALSLAVPAGSAAAFALALLLPLVVAWLVLLVRMGFYPQTIVLEGRGGVGGLARSWRLTHRSFWRVLGITLLVGIIAAMFSSIISLPVSLLTSGLQATTGHLASQATSSLVGVLTAPFTAIAAVLLYYDLRIRREAFDIEMLAASL